MNLTIAIPTYERSENLSNLLNSIKSEYEKLTDHEKKSITIYVSDNTRSPKQLKLNQDLILETKIVINNIIYDLNKYNIGGNQNILKCIEYPKSGWVWVIGDDDILINNSLKYIIDLIPNYNDFSSMTFCSTQNFTNPPEVISDFNDICITNNINDYLNNVYINNACFIPCNLYNVEYYNLFSDRICESTFTQFPHFVYALLCLDSGYKNLTSNKVIVASLPPTWQKIHVDSRLFSLFLLPFKKNESLTSIKKLIQTQKPNFKSKLSFLYRNVKNNNTNIENIQAYYLSMYKYTKLKNDLPLLLYKIFITLKNKL